MMGLKAATSLFFHLILFTCSDLLTYLTTVLFWYPYYIKSKPTKHKLLEASRNRMGKEVFPQHLQIL